MSTKVRDRNNPLHHLEPMQREYLLNCKILMPKITYPDEQSQGNLGMMTRRVVLLVPEESSEMYRFYDAWMGIPPDLTGESANKRVECLIRFDHPFHEVCRAALMHPKSRDKESLLEEHHLFLMAYGLSEIIIAKYGHLKRPKHVLVTTLAADDDGADACPTDGVGKGDDLFSGTRKKVVTGVETPENLTDRHGRIFPPLKG